METAKATAFVATTLAAAGCGALLDIQVYDEGGTSSVDASAGPHDAQANTDAFVEGAAATSDRACPDGQAQCDGTCVDTVTDNNNCGACATRGSAYVCPSGTQCGDGQCQCTTSGLMLCGSSCVNEMSDGANCGTCRHDCQGGACLSGQCQPASALFVDGSRAYWLVGNGAMNGAVMRLGPSDSMPFTFASNLSQLCVDTFGERKTAHVFAPVSVERRPYFVFQFAKVFNGRTFLACGYPCTMP